MSESTIPAIPPTAAIQSTGAHVAGREETPATNRSGLPVNTPINGFVINRDANANPVVRTAFGDVTVPSVQFIKSGSEVVFQLAPSANAAPQIISINQLTPTDYTAAQTPRPGAAGDSINASTLASQTPGAAQPATQTPNVATHYPVLQAVVLQTNPTIALPPLLAQLQAGTPLTLTLHDVELPPIPVALNAITEPSAFAKLLPEAVAQTPALPVPPTLSASNAVNAALLSGNAAYAQSVAAGTIAPLLAGAVSPTTGKPATPDALPEEEAEETPPNPSEPPASSSAAKPPTSTRTGETGSSLNAPAAANAALPSLIAAENPAVAAASLLPPPTPGTAASALPVNAKIPPPLAEPALQPAVSVPVIQAAHNPLASAGFSALPSQPPTSHALPNIFSPSPPTAVVPNQAVNSAALPTAQPGVAPTPTIPGTTIPATVIGHGEDGLNILQTPYATVKLYTAQPLPTGTTLHVALEVAAAQTSPLLTAFSELGKKLGVATERFSYLSPALAQLAVQDPTAGRDLQQPLPVMGARFTSGLLFFIAAVKNGTLDEAINPTRQKTIDALLPGMLTKFAKDIAELNQQFTQSPLTDWKSITLPLIFGHEMQQAKLYVRDEHEGEPSKAEAIGGGQRFVLDVHFSEIGALQFDGFVRAAESTKSFELYLRSAAPLDSDFTQSIRQLFANITEGSGLKGTLVFQAGEAHFMKPQLKPPPATVGGQARTILA